MTRQSKLPYTNSQTRRQHRSTHRRRREKFGVPYSIQTTPTPPTKRRRETLTSRDHRRKRRRIRLGRTKTRPHRRRTKQHRQEGDGRPTGASRQMKRTRTACRRRPRLSPFSQPRSPQPAHDCHLPATRTTNSQLRPPSHDLPPPAAHRGRSRGREWRPREPPPVRHAKAPQPVRSGRRAARSKREGGASGTAAPAEQKHK